MGTHVVHGVERHSLGVRGNHPDHLDQQHVVQPDVVRHPVFQQLVQLPDVGGGFHRIEVGGNLLDGMGDGRMIFLVQFANLAVHQIDAFRPHQVFFGAEVIDQKHQQIAQRFDQDGVAAAQART